MSGTVEHMVASEGTVKIPAASVLNQKNVSNQSINIKQIADVSSAYGNPVNLEVSEKTRARIISLGQQIENIRAQLKNVNSISRAMEEIRQALTDIKDLASTSPENDVIDSAFMKSFRVDGKNLVQEYNSILYNSQFEEGLINSSGAMMQIGPMFQLNFNGAFTAEKAVEYLDRLIGAVDQVKNNLAKAGSGRMQSQLSSMNVAMQNLQSNSKMTGLRTVADIAGNMQTQIKKNAALAMNAHSSIEPSTTLPLIQ